MFSRRIDAGAVVSSIVANSESLWTCTSCPEEPPCAASPSSGPLPSECSPASSPVPDALSSCADIPNMDISPDISEEDAESPERLIPDIPLIPLIPDMASEPRLIPPMPEDAPAIPLISDIPLIPPDIPLIPDMPLIPPDIPPIPDMPAADWPWDWPVNSMSIRFSRVMTLVSSRISTFRLTPSTVTCVELTSVVSFPAICI